LKSNWLANNLSSFLRLNSPIEANNLVMRLSQFFECKMRIFGEYNLFELGENCLKRYLIKHTALTKTKKERNLVLFYWPTIGTCAIFLSLSFSRTLFEMTRMYGRANMVNIVWSKQPAWDSNNWTSFFLNI
jgi:hypothetical protein